MEQLKQKIAQLEAENKSLASELDTEKLKVYQREDEIIALKLDNNKILDQYGALKQQLTPNQAIDHEKTEALYETIKQHKETIEKQRRELDLWREYSEKDKKVRCVTTR
jgi:methyl-accepting chemotaxis protein